MVDGRPNLYLENRYTRLNWPAWLWHCCSSFATIWPPWVILLYESVRARWCYRNGQADAPEGPEGGGCECCWEVFRYENWWRMEFIYNDNSVAGACHVVLTLLHPPANSATQGSRQASRQAATNAKERQLQWNYSEAAWALTGDIYGERSVD